jgi:CheY-like chemotaxis protein
MKQKPAATSEKKKILVVEDDASVSRLISAVLAKANYEVVEASYSLPALFRVVRNLPDLILVDINLPIMNGLELIEQFKGHKETRNVPIVAMTGMDTPETRQAARKLGCVGFISKPFDTREFPLQIARFINGQTGH